MNRQIANKKRREAYEEKRREAEEEVSISHSYCFERPDNLEVPKIEYFGNLDLPVSIKVSPRTDDIQFPETI